MAGLNTAIKYTDREGTIPNIDVLQYGGDKECGGEFDAFDVGKKSGKLIMIKYKTGSRCLGGVYTSDKNGNDYTQIIDMGQWSSLSSIYEGTFSKIFWNRDETLFTMNASFQDDSGIYQGLLVFDSNGELKSQIYAQPNQSIIIYGWSSDSKFILFSLSACLWCLSLSFTSLSLSYTHTHTVHAVVVPTAGRHLASKYTHSSPCAAAEDRIN